MALCILTLIIGFSGDAASPPAIGPAEVRSQNTWGWSPDVISSIGTVTSPIWVFLAAWFGASYGNKKQRERDQIAAHERRERDKEAAAEQHKAWLRDKQMREYVEYYIHLWRYLYQVRHAIRKPLYVNEEYGPPDWDEMQRRTMSLEMVASAQVIDAAHLAFEAIDDWLREHEDLRNSSKIGTNATRCVKHFMKTARRELGLFEDFDRTRPKPDWYVELQWKDE